MRRLKPSSMRSPASISIAACWRSVERAPMPSAEALLSGLGPRALVVVLSAIANHDNMGGICRNAAAFGADAVILDSDCCDPFYRKAIRVSVGAALVLPFARVASADAALDLLSAHGFQVLALSPAGATPLGEVTRAGPRRRALRRGRAGPAAGGDRSRHGRAHRHGGRHGFAQRRHGQRHRAASPGVILKSRAAARMERSAIWVGPPPQSASLLAGYRGLLVTPARTS